MPLVPSLPLIKWKTTNMTLLSRVTQRKKETIREYIDRFTKVAVVIGGSDDRLKCWMFKKGLRPDCMF